MLSRNLKRALLDTRWPLPPPFLLPWAANLATLSHTTETSETSNTPPPITSRLSKANPAVNKTTLPPPSPQRQDDLSKPALPPPNSLSSPLALSPSLRDLLPLLTAQPPHYITIHIHGRPYLVTQGDTLRLRFLMRGVAPGDILRFNRAINAGSRDYTLKAAASAPKLKSPTASQNAIDSSAVIATGSVEGEAGVTAPHFIPHIAKGKYGYLDERLFVCRAVVMGVESEPLRIKEKTKRRQRRVKRVLSKHRFTILRVREARVRSLAELEAEEGV